MADSKSDRGPEDRTRVNVHEDYELRYWTAKWNVTAEELRRAVTKVGVSAEAVGQELHGGSGDRA